MTPRQGVALASVGMALAGIVASIYCSRETSDALLLVAWLLCWLGLPVHGPSPEREP